MILSKLSKKAAGINPEFSNQLDEGEQIARAVSDELRTTSYLLHPPLLDEMGLQAGLRWYIEGFKGRSNIKVSLSLPKNLERLPTDLELMIFRVVQECLTNIHRHSGSASATICLSNSNGTLTLEIRDQGKGMSADRLAAVTGPGKVGVGLCGMREPAYGAPEQPLGDSDTLTNLIPSRTLSATGTKHPHTASANSIQENALWV
jgi:signal transduction histidine kinase